MTSYFSPGQAKARCFCAALIWLAAAFCAPSIAQKPGIDPGKKIATEGNAPGVAACVSCHGARGEGSAAFPRLAGTGQAYLQAQLDAFGDGSRKNALMQPIAQKLSPAERREVARYFSELPAPYQSADPAQPLPADAGAWLATRGRWTGNVPACVQCHGPGGSGVGSQFPPLAGLPAAYIAEQLLAWKAGTRPPGPLGLMPLIAQKLSEADMAAVASYYATLAEGTAPATASSPASTPRSRP